MIKTIVLFGKKIDVEVADDYNGDSAIVSVPVPAPVPINVIVPEFMFEKKIEQSDVALNQGRLLMPFCSKLFMFLTEEDRKEKLMSQDSQESSSSSSSSSSLKKKMKGVDVEMVNIEGRRFGMKLLYWGSVKKFVLNKGWNSLVKETGLQKGDVIQVWCYGRSHDNKLCFYLDIRQQRICS